MSLFLYLSYSVDSYQADMCCDGIRHFTLHEGSGSRNPALLSDLGPCDGSCQPGQLGKDLREFIRARSQGSLEGDDLTTRSSVLEVEESAQAVFDGDDPVEGVEYDRWYYKRDGEGCTCCTGTHHVWVSVRFEYLAQDGHPDRFETIKVRAEPCDQSCQRIDIDPEDLTAHLPK